MTKLLKYIFIILPTLAGVCADRPEEPTMPVARIIIKSDETRPKIKPSIPPIVVDSPIETLVLTGKLSLAQYLDSSYFCISYPRVSPYGVYQLKIRKPPYWPGIDYYKKEDGESPKRPWTRFYYIPGEGFRFAVDYDMYQGYLNCEYVLTGVIFKRITTGPQAGEQLLGRPIIGGFEPFEVW